MAIHWLASRPSHDLEPTVWASRLGLGFQRSHKINPTGSWIGHCHGMSDTMVQFCKGLAVNKWNVGSRLLHNHTIKPHCVYITWSLMQIFWRRVFQRCKVLQFFRAQVEPIVVLLTEFNMGRRTSFWDLNRQTIQNEKMKMAIAKINTKWHQKHEGFWKFFGQKWSSKVVSLGLKKPLKRAKNNRLPLANYE